MEQTEFIKRSRRNVMMRISVFMLYYILVLVFTFVLLLLLIVASAFFLFNITAFLNRMGIALMMLLGASWIFVVKNGFQLLRSPFIETKYERDDHIEVTEEECPKLFKSILDVATFTGCEMPKHVYLCSDVNACLFYNTSFWNIFFPVKKQLEIGIGLMNCMSTEELKSIIAHEFGHYTQKTGKIDGIINRTITVLDNMMRNLELPGFLQTLTFKVYRFVQRGNFRFSRQLEYNADSVSCACVGKNTFISAMCKVEILAQRQNLYEVFLTHLLEEKKLCENYWGGYDCMIPIFEKNDAVRLDFSRPLFNPICTPSTLNSRLKVNDIWSTHPSLEDRIREANKTEKVSFQDEAISVDARSLVPEEILNKLGLVRLDSIKKDYCNNLEVESITCDKFEEWAEKKQKQLLIPASLVPFLQRDFCSLVDENLLHCQKEYNGEEEPENPFTIENMSILKRYQSEEKDLSLMRSIESGAYEVTEFLYNGKLYNKKTNPVKKQLEEVNAFRPKATKVDNAIFSYLLYKSEKKHLIVRNYDIVRYTQQIQPRLLKLTEIRNSIIATLNSVAETGRQLEKSEYNSLLGEIEYLSVSIGSVTKALNYDLLSDVLNSESVSYLSEYHKISHCSSVEIKPNQVNAMSRLVDLLFNMHGDMYRHSSAKLVEEIEKHVPSENKNVLFEHLRSRMSIGNGCEDVALDAEYMERVKNSETWTIMLCLLGELVALVALIMAIHFSSSTIYNHFFGPDYVIVKAQDGEQSDGLIAFKVPAGFVCEHFEETKESAGGYFLSSPDCSIELYGGVSDEFSKNDCINLWKSFAESRGYPTETEFLVNLSTFYEKKKKTFKRTIEMVDNEENVFIWDFQIVYDSELRKYSIISVVKSADCHDDIDMAKEIRFE